MGLLEDPNFRILNENAADIERGGDCNLSALTGGPAVNHHASIRVDFDKI